MAAFLAVYALAGIICILASLGGKEKARGLSKVLIIPALTGVYIAGKGFELLPVAALVFGWIGDILLLKKGKTFFLLGLGSFLLGHLCYLFCFAFRVESLDILVLVLSCAALGLLSVAVFRVIRPFREMVIPIIIYMTIIGSMCCVGLQVLFVQKNLAGTLIFLGCILFLVSDATLGYFRFRAKSRYASAAVIGTYILAQAGIILGLILL